MQSVDQGGAEMNSAALYQERFDRIQKAIHLEPVDRIPVVYMGVAFAPRYMGMSIAEFCVDPEATVKMNLAAMDKLGGLDGINLAGAGRITAILTAMWLSRLGVPGRDLPPDSLWQVREAEVMTIDDYNFIIKNGWQAFLGSYLPRVIDMSEFGEAMGWLMANQARCMSTYRERGYVPVCGAATSPPYEYFCGGRSMQKFIFDLHRIPDKVQAAMDAIMPDIIGQAIGIARASGVAGVWVGGWRSASALISPKLWDRFAWPYFVKIVYALVEAGLTPVLHWDQDWTRDLGRLRELPAKKCILNPDGMTNIHKFKEVAGDRMAMMGDVPATMFAAGTPEDIYNYVRNLVHLFGSTGLILCPGCDAPINTKPENMEAFVAAGREYGKVT
jgi:uroporphyrinogen-III decarboxylase